MTKQINLGCGNTPTEGWTNYDNSWSIRLAGVPSLARWACMLGLLNRRQREFVAFAQQACIKWADVTRRIPEVDSSVAAVYSSHMLEHLDRDEASRFLKEAHRVLAPGAVIRIAVPDLRRYVDDYLATGDADNFIRRTRLAQGRPKSLGAKLNLLFIGFRHHLWMYDGESLCRQLVTIGFCEPRVMEPGTTRITRPGALDLHERMEESVFVEALKP